MQVRWVFSGFVCVCSGRLVICRRESESVVLTQSLAFLVFTCRDKYLPLQYGDPALRYLLLLSSAMTSEEPNADYRHWGQATLGAIVTRVMRHFSGFLDYKWFGTLPNKTKASLVPMLESWPPELGCRISLHQETFLKRIRKWDTECHGASSGWFGALKGLGRTQRAKHSVQSTEACPSPNEACMQEC